MEWIVASVPLVIAVVGLGVNLFLDSKNRSSRTFGSWTPSETKAVLTARDRSDIYRDMAWWDREFRKLCGEPEPTNQLSASMNQAIGALQRFGLIGLTPTVEEINPGVNITYNYNVLAEEDYRAEMKKVLND